MSGSVPGEIRVGISGWRYKGWRGVFYPPKLAQHRELAYAAQQFPSVEINGTFYSLQRPTCFRQWYAATPAGFVFAVKGPRFITHLKQLVDVETPLANFFASGLLDLKEKLGPILWQFAPRFRFNPGKLERFFEQLPRDTAQAAALARGHDARIKDPSLEADQVRPIRHAIEIRHESFRDAAFIEMLRRHEIALVFADTPSWPYFEDLTADFAYLRLHGSEQLYASGYDDDALDWWGARVLSWAAGTEPNDARKVTLDPPTRRPRDVYVYFDNDAKVRAPFDAQGLIRRVAPESLTAPLPEGMSGVHAQDPHRP